MYELKVCVLANSNHPKHTAGFERIQFERFDSDICIGRSIEEAIQFALEIGPAGEILRC